MINSTCDNLVAVTGASGFIGSKLSMALETNGRRVRRVMRRNVDQASVVCVGDVGPDTNWQVALESVDCVIHTVARAHFLDDTATAASGELSRVNTVGSRRLAEQAALSGVRRLIFISSIGVLGNDTNDRPPFDNSTTPVPKDDYSLSKWEAERALVEVAENTGLETVIIRPPLVYGHRAPGNFGRLARLVERGVPLPLGLVDNRRSFVALDNLINLLIHCIDHPAAAGQTFLVSDNQDISTPEFIRGLAKVMGRNANLLPVPIALLRLGGRLTGRLSDVERLVGSLQVDIRQTCETLGWAPPITVEEGLRRAVGGRV